MTQLCVVIFALVLSVKSLMDYTNLFSPKTFKKNDDIILNYFLNKL